LLWIVLISFHSTMFEHVDIILNYTCQNPEVMRVSLALLEEFASLGTIYHLMLSTLSAWTHSSVYWLMFVLYANVCRLLYSYLFLGTCQYSRIYHFFSLLYVFFVFFVFVGANEMHSQLMVGACCVCICFICLLKVNNLLVFFGHVLVFCLGTCVSYCMFFVQYIIHTEMKTSEHDVSNWEWY